MDIIAKYITNFKEFANNPSEATAQQLSFNTDHFSDIETLKKNLKQLNSEESIPFLQKLSNDLSPILETLAKIDLLKNTLGCEYKVPKIGVTNN